VFPRLLFSNARQYRYSRIRSLSCRLSPDVCSKSHKRLVSGLFVLACSRLPCRRLPKRPIRKRSGVSVVEGRNHPKNDPKWCIDTNEPPRIHEGGSRRTFFAKPTFHAFTHPTRCVSTFSAFSEPLRPTLPFPPFHHPAWTIAFGRRDPFCKPCYHRLISSPNNPTTRSFSELLL
jgi:hypothetical protein